MVDQRSGSDNRKPRERRYTHPWTAGPAKKDMQEGSERKMQQTADLSMLKKKKTILEKHIGGNVHHGGRTTTIRAMMKWTCERSVTRKPETSAPLIAVVLAVNARSCPKEIRYAWENIFSRFRVRESSNTCLGCVASLAEHTARHIVAVLILRSKKVFWTRSRHRSRGS
jgi:hypothetical protein